MPSKASAHVQHSPGMLAVKCALRLAVLPDPDDRPARVLDAYAGDHDIWDMIGEVRPGLEVLHIEQKPTVRTDLAGNNLRYLASMDLDRFDLIDLDAWGQPDRQVDIIASRGFRGVVTWTAIALNMGVPSGRLLAAEGIDPEWMAITRTVFDVGTFRRRWLNFLAFKGWQEAVVIEKAGRGGYLYGSVGHTSWDDALYRDAYDQVRATGRYARLSVGRATTLAR